MKKTQKWYQKTWFKPAVIFISVLLIIVLIKLQVHQPFENFFQKFKQKNVESNYQMEEIITSDDPYLGNKEAVIRMVEFGDFNCSYCQKAHSIMRELMLEYEDKVFYQFRDYPVVSQQSIWLAMAAD